MNTFGKIYSVVRKIPQGKVASYGQVALLAGVKREFILLPLTKESLRYDAYFENQILAHSLGLAEEELCVNLYGGKKDNQGKPYWLTKKTNSALTPIRSFGMQFRPMDANILYQLAGDTFGLYEVKNQVVECNERSVQMREVDYDIRSEGLSLKNVGKWIGYRLRNH